MDLGLKGKLALVTASSGGLGRSIADGLAAEGANLVLFARSKDKLEAIARETADRHDVEVLAQAGSMLDAADVQRLSATLRDLGGPDVVVLLDRATTDPTAPDAGGDRARHAGTRPTATSCPPSSRSSTQSSPS